MGMVPRTPRPSGAHSPRQTGSGQHPGGPRRLGRGWKQQPPPSKEACTRHKRGPEAAAGTGRQSERAGGQAQPERGTNRHPRCTRRPAQRGAGGHRLGAAETGTQPPPRRPRWHHRLARRRKQRMMRMGELGSVDGVDV